jgi:propanol-preferring alcohol dehydrogenase
VFAFTRDGDEAGQDFARTVGCEWAGDGTARPPAELDAAIIFAPVGALVPEALASTGPGGIVVCAGIHMSEIPAFPYDLLWRERQLHSVANLTRRDGEEFLPLAAEAEIRPEVTVYGLEDAAGALRDLRSGSLTGSAVLRVAGD